MKKKNVLTMAMSLALVGVIAVGGTMAYLSASDGAVQNTFTFVSSGDDGKAIKVELTEEEPTNLPAGVTVSGNVNTGWSYSNVLPEQTLEKKPHIDVTAYTPTYVYVKIEAGNVTTGAIGSAWTKLEGVDGVTNVYYHEVTAEQITEDLDKEFDLGYIFTTVTTPDVNETAMKDTVLDPIKISVAAVSVGSYTSAADAYTKASVESLYQDVTSAVSDQA